MFVRRLALSLFVGAVLAGSAAGVSAAGGYKFSAILSPFPPLVNVPLPAMCQVHFDPNTELTCTATAPNPDPPKDTKTLKVEYGSNRATCKVTAYPDGGVVLSCHYRGVEPL